MFDFLKKIFGLPTEKEIAEARRAAQAAAQVPYKVEAPTTIETVATPTEPAKKVEEAKPVKTRKPRAKKVEVVAVKPAKPAKAAKEKAAKPVAKRTTRKSAVQ